MEGCLVNSVERMIAACSCQHVDRPPVWLMRQAGRYLPEYLELRRKHSFWDVLRSPALALEVALQPFRRFQLDAAILFSDILVLLDAMGAQVAYTDKGPSMGRPFRGARDLPSIYKLDPHRDLPWVGEAMELLCQHMHPQRAVIGFAGAPLTLAAYLCEGGPSKDLRTIKSLSYRDPHLVQDLLLALADAVADLLIMQVDAGADLLQVFDTWAGNLSPQDHELLCVPANKRLAQRLKERDVPVILYERGAASHLESSSRLGFQVHSIDTSLSLSRAREILPAGTAIQGNTDPAVLMAPPEYIHTHVREMIQRAGHLGLIVNLGQGLVPEIPVEGVAAFVRAVTEYQAP